MAQPFTRKVLIRIFNADAQNFISQDNSSVLYNRVSIFSFSRTRMRQKSQKPLYKVAHYLSLGCETSSIPAHNLWKGSQFSWLWVMYWQAENYSNTLPLALLQPTCPFESSRTVLISLTSALITMLLKGPRLNLIAPRSVLPFWNGLGERIPISVVKKYFTELPWAEPPQRSEFLNLLRISEFFGF